MSSTAEPSTRTPPVVYISSTTSSGVSTTPRMFDREALTIAAGTLPCAIEVKAIDDCTVDGRTQRKSIPVYKAGGRIDFGTRDD